MNNPGGSLNIGAIEIKKGIFQGDALSALWFCMAINPLSTILNNTGIGYQIPNSQITVSHLLYMDDLKLYATTRDGLNRLLKETEKFSKDIKMEFGLDKCKLNSVTAGVTINSDVPYTLQNDHNQQITSMDIGEMYRYLGYEQAKGIDQKRSKTVVTTNYKQRLKSILKTYLNARNKSRAINTYAISSLTYTFGILKWTQTELEDLDRMTRTMMTKFRIHHPKSAVERVNLPRKKGGRGIINIHQLHDNQMKKLQQYFAEKTLSSEFHKAITKSDDAITVLNLKNTSTPQEVENMQSKRMDMWCRKQIHGKFPCSLKQVYIDQDASHAWLRKGVMFGETEGFMLAIQDGVIATKNYRKYIIKDETVTNDNCRMCNQFTENIQHIISGCTVLASIEYTRRHNNVAKVLHQHILKKYGIKENIDPYYQYTPNAVEENECAKVYWDRKIITDKPIQSNIPDIVVLDKTNNNTLLIDVTIPNFSNIQKKYAEKIDKYQPLAIEVKELWRQDRVTVIPVVVGSMGEVPKSLHESLKAIGVKDEIYIEMQKIVILETCGIVRKVMGCGD